MKNEVIKEKTVQEITFSKEDVENCEKVWKLWCNFADQLNNFFDVGGNAFECFVTDIASKYSLDLEKNYFQFTSDDVDDLIIKFEN